MLPVLSCRVNTELDLMVREVCRTASGHPWGEGVWEGGGDSPGFTGAVNQWIAWPFLPNYLHAGGFAEHNWVDLCAGSSFCLSFSCVIRSSYRKVWITGEKAKKIPKSKNKAKQEGVKHELARAKGLALILLLALVFIQRLWIQVNFLGSIFIAVLLALNWNNERFVDWVQRLSHFVLSPASPSLCAGFKQFILISDFSPSVVNCCCATSSSTWGTIVRLFKVVGAHSRAISSCEAWPSPMISHFADSEQDKHFKGEGKYQTGYFSSEKVVEISCARVKK